MLKKQDYPDFEIIVIDNASKDKTAEVARGMGVRVVREDRKGTMWACERGRLEALGEIIVRMDADCMPTPDWLTRGVRHFKDTNVSAVTGPYDYYDADKFFRYSSLFFQKNIYWLANAILYKTKKAGITIGGNSFLRASAMKKAGGFNTAISFYGDDMDTAMRVAQSGRIIFDRHLAIKTSARRFKSHGVFKLTTIYWYHFFAGIFKSTKSEK